VFRFTTRCGRLRASSRAANQIDVAHTAFDPVLGAGASMSCLGIGQPALPARRRRSADVALSALTDIASWPQPETPQTGHTAAASTAAFL